jgi:hypothetical protein
METVNEALSKGIDLIKHDDGDQSVAGIARLVRQDARVVAVVAIEIVEKNEPARQEILRRLQWGSAWIEVIERRRSSETDEYAIERLTLALDAIAVVGEHSGFRASAAAALTSLSVQLKASRVSFGTIAWRGCRVMAVSNITRFDKRVESVRAIAEAMDEAVDQLSAINEPAETEDDQALVRRKANRLRESSNASLVMVQPVVRDGKPAGALVFEWSEKEPPPQHIREAVADITALLAPVLIDRLREERWVLAKVLISLRGQVARLLGLGYLGRKLTVIALASIVAFFSLFTTSFHVTSDAKLRGSVERVMISPIDGYIQEAFPRAGDTVETGGLMVKFDDVEFQLERQAWVARKLQFEKEFAQALAIFDRAGINILRARIEEADAQIKLYDTRIALTSVKAPFEAVVVSGDLSQSLGQSVRRGDELYRIAPLDEYLVEIDVLETDILFIEEGASGKLVLASLPFSELSIVIDTITPVTSAQNGSNYFLVEARLVNPDAVPVAPGMEGIVKIDAGEKRLIWIWTRRLTDWAQMRWWRWMP